MVRALGARFGCFRRFSRRATKAGAGAAKAKGRKECFMVLSSPEMSPSVAFWHDRSAPQVLLASPLPSTGPTLRGRATGGRLRKWGERCGAVGMSDDGTTPSASPISLRVATRPSDLFPFSACAPAPARRGAGAAGLGDDVLGRPVAVRAAGLTRGARRRWPRREGVRAGSCRAIRRPA